MNDSQELEIWNITACFLRRRSDRVSNCTQNELQGCWIWKQKEVWSFSYSLHVNFIQNGIAEIVFVEEEENEIANVGIFDVIENLYLGSTWALEFLCQSERKFVSDEKLLSDN